MGNVTKIMLILNILAGGAGIFFGMGIKGDLKTAQEAKGKAEADAQTAKGGTSKLQTDNQKLSTDLQNLQGQFAKATNDLGAAQSTLASLQGGQGQMAADLQQSTDNAQLNLTDGAQTLANQTQKLKGDIAAYEALGTTQEIRVRLSKLDKIEADAAAKKKKAQDAAKNKPKPNTPKPGAEVGSVASFDPKFGFAVLNRGASHGIKVGDVFRVTRNGQLVGKVTVQKADPTTAIANPIKQFTREPLKAGDKLVKDS